MKATQQERIVAALKERGSDIVPSKSRKYVTLTRSGTSRFFVGKAGSLRIGGTYTASVPADERFKARLLAEVNERGELVEPKSDAIPIRWNA